MSRNGQALFYLEAIAVSNSVGEEAEANRMNQVYDALNNLASPDFYLGLRVEGAPETPPAGRGCAANLPDGWRRSTAKQSGDAISKSDMKTFQRMNGATMGGALSSIPYPRATKPAGIYPCARLE